MSATFSTGSYCTADLPFNCDDARAVSETFSTGSYCTPKFRIRKGLGMAVSATFSTGSYCTAADDLEATSGDLCPPPSAPAATALCRGAYVSTPVDRVRHLQHRQLLHPI